MDRGRDVCHLSQLVLGGWAHRRGAAPLTYLLVVQLLRQRHIIVQITGL